MPVFKVKPFEGEGGGGGVTLVDTLPEVGDESLIYKTPDGKLYSCVNTEETKVICDLEVGKSYKLVESISYEELSKLTGTTSSSIVNDSIIFDNEQNEPYLLVEQTFGPEAHYVGYWLDPYRGVFYDYDSEDPKEIIDAQLEELEEIPTVTITQDFVDNATANNYALEDFIAIFQNSSHTETVTVCTWTEIGAGGGSSQLYQQMIHIVSSPEACNRTNIILNVLTNTNEPLDDFDKLFNYFKARNFIADVDNFTSNGLFAIINEYSPAGYPATFEGVMDSDIEGQNGLVFSFGYNNESGEPADWKYPYRLDFLVNTETGTELVKFDVKILPMLIAE